MNAMQAGGLAVLFALGSVVALFFPETKKDELEKHRPLLARWLLVAAIFSAGSCALINQGCAETKSERPPVPDFRLLDPCPGGRRDYTQEFGCAIDSSR
jgi:hypothetical protein